MNEIKITGYEQNGQCEHCGRGLKHCIRISDGRMVGAQCLDKSMTAPKSYNGAAYRVGAENIIRMARLASKYSSAVLSRNYGIRDASLTFQLA